jgi:hypothetical protein
MLYTQGQVRDLLDVPVETLRRWRDGLSALARHKGHGPTFSPGDVVALALTADLVNIYGIRVNTLAARLDELFELCHGCSWLTLESCVIVISADETRMMQADDPRRDVADGIVLSVPCRPVVQRLRTKLIAAEIHDPQTRLKFPPTSLTAQAQ